MTNELQPTRKHHNFFFENLPVRVVINESGEPEWVAKDVCEVLGYADTESTLRKLDDDEKGTQEIRTPGGPQRMSTVNESGLYTLAIRSNKPQAKPFRRWVTHEVLPSIRKTGGYVHPAAGVQAPVLDILRQMYDRLGDLELRVGQFQINSNVYGPVWSFGYTCCIIDQHYLVGKAELYEAYERYCQVLGVHKESKNQFFMRLYHAIRSTYASTITQGGRKIRVVRGIGLRHDQLERVQEEKRRQDEENRRRSWQWWEEHNRLFPLENSPVPEAGHDR